jgi:hypothetical protein
LRRRRPIAANAHSAHSRKKIPTGSEATRSDIFIIVVPESEDELLRGTWSGPKTR